MVGVLVETERINADNPVFIEIGINPADLAGFGVHVVAGRPYMQGAEHEAMLGWRAPANLGLKVGFQFHANGMTNTVVGLYSTRKSNTSTDSRTSSSTENANEWPSLEHCSSAAHCRLMVLPAVQLRDRSGAPAPTGPW